MLISTNIKKKNSSPLSRFFRDEEKITVSDAATCAERGDSPLEYTRVERLGQRLLQRTKDLFPEDLFPVDINVV